MDACFMRLDAIFNYNSQVIESARVGAGYDQQLNDIMDAEIQPILQDFYQTPNYVSGCYPPCGFQDAGAVYNCKTCKYDSCEFPLDCPVEEIKVMENTRIRMWCKVPFDLPSDFQAVWRFAEELNTQQLDEFKEVTAGVDTLFSIPSTSPHHQGTYQCEIYSDQRSIVRLYYYLSVTPQNEVGHTELQEIFDLSLLPGGSLLPTADLSRHSRPSAVLLGAYVSAVLLLLLLSLGYDKTILTKLHGHTLCIIVSRSNILSCFAVLCRTLYLLSTSEKRGDVETDAIGDPKC
ncbi:sperm acrosome associated 6 isoform X1 [Periophthalmus magnuspinnatus]|uniref:sperm acrosome associated 6 isoform X1 n=1 Tax=Periophthalmus magnuspinnatus TaxID=409849 RepID=UPI002436C56C|nr:sperm acrosome associated 6 isoform X1 [Periophthalmus magnuspinnatus]